MILLRAVLVVCLTTLLGLVLYLPSATPPEQFMSVLRAEHQLNIDALGADRAHRALARMLDMLQDTPRISEAPAPPVHAASATPVDAAMAEQIGQMNRRLFGNPYFRSLDSLAALATFRASTLRELAPVALGFLLACAFDGLMVRAVRSKEFGQHSPELFSIAACCAVLLLCALVVASVVPRPISPYWLMAALVAVGIAAAGTVANYRRRG